MQSKRKLLITPKMTARFSVADSSYYAFFTRSYSSFLRVFPRFMLILEKYERIQSTNKNIDDYFDLHESKKSELRTIQNDVYYFGINTIIFACMTLEAAINNFGAMYLGDKNYQNYFNKLDLVSKLKFLPELITGYEFRKGHLAENRLKKLIAYRNKLIHWKSKSEYDLTKLVDTEKKFGREVQDSYETIIYTSLELDRILSKLSPLINIYLDIESPIRIPKNLRKIAKSCERKFQKSTQPLPDLDLSEILSEKNNLKKCGRFANPSVSPQ